MADAGSHGAAPDRDADWLLYELGGKHRAQVLSTLAALGVPDALHQRGACDLDALASLLGCDRADLESLVRAAAGLGCLDEVEPETFALTARGEQLCSHRLGALAAFLGSRAQWDGWSRLRDSMKDGDPTPPLARAMGAGLYDYLAADPRAAAEYDAAIDAFTRREAALLEGRIDLDGVTHIVDVGGGRGGLLASLIVQAEGATGVLFDLPHVAEAARSQLPPRVEAVGGDFFDAVPEGGDLYVLKHVLHNWPDEDAARILANCCSARADGGRVLVLDAVLAPDNRPDLARLLDLEMRVLCGGRERRKPELRRLLQRAGLRIEQAEELDASTWLFVCR